jgi:mRNA-degrading endonuclease RelE of RelBE toxin-antitoxin system
VTAEEPVYALRVTGPAERQLSRLPEGTAAAIVEFMLGALLDNPHRLGGVLQCELAGMRSARRGVYRIIYEIDDTERLVIVYRIDHRSTAYRPH